MSSASAIAASASSEALDVVRRDPDALDARRPHDLGLAIDDPAPGDPGVERDRGRRDGHDLAPHGEDPVHQADAVLEVAALDGGHGGDQQVAEGVAGQSGRLAGRLREPVLEDLAHQRLGVGEGHDAVADVADGRDAELVAQDAGRAAVVGHGDDRGQVARVLLEAPQQRREARPAADGHDPRAAREEPLLVDQLDERLVRIGRAQRIGQDPDGPVGADGDEHDADRARDEPAQGERQELEGQEVDDAAGQAGRREVARDLAQEMGERDGEQEEAGEDDDQPALDPDAGGQPAPEVHVRSSSRWKTATGPKSCSRSQVASSSAMTIERWKPPGAADADRQPGLALGDVGGHGEGQELLQVRQELGGDGLGQHERPDLVGQAGERPELGVVVRVLHEPDVEHEVRLERDPELEPEADELERQLVGPDVRRQRGEQPLAELAQRQVRGVEDDVRIGADRVEPPALLGDRAGDALRPRRADGGGASR